MKKLTTLILILTFVCCGVRSHAQTSCYDVVVSDYGGLEKALGDKWKTIDSLVIHGPVDEADINMMWMCSFYGKTTVLNLADAQVKDNTIPYGAFFERDFQDTGSGLARLNLRRIILPETIETIEDYAFNRSMLEHINMPSALKKLGPSCFANCDRLAENPLIIPEGVEEIPDLCFTGCYSLKKVVLPAGLKTIGTMAFHDSRISEVNLPEGLETIGMNAFSATDLAGAAIPSTVVTLGEGIFTNCPYLKSLSLPENLKEIPASFASSCQQLETVNIPADIETIGHGAFQNDVNITKLVLPEGLRRIGYSAFEGISVEEIVFPASLEYLGSGSCASWTAIKKIQSLSPMPPACEAGGATGVFERCVKDVPVYVPAGWGSKYRSSEGWSYFNNIIEVADGTLSVGAPDTEAHEGTTAAMKAYIIGGKAPYNVTWLDKMNQEFASETYYDDECTAMVELAASASGDITVMVTDSRGAVATAVQRLKVLGAEKDDASFEDVYVGAQRYSNGRYKIDDGAPAEGWYNTFVSGPFQFASYTPALFSWNTGFTCTDLETSDYKADDKHLVYATAAQTGHNYSSQYVTLCDSAYVMLVCGDKSRKPLEGFYVSLSEVSLKSVREGSALAPAFGQGDYLCLTITDETNGKSTDFYVADYRSADASEHYSLDTWQWVDIRQLESRGKKLKFTLSGTQVQNDGQTGFAMPALVCIDDFNGALDVTETSAQTLTSGQAFDLSELFPEPAGTASVEYSIYNVDGYSARDMQLDIDGSMLTVTLCQDDMQAGDVDVTVRQKSAGRSLYVRFPMSVASGISEVKADAEVMSRYLPDGRAVNADTRGEGINIIRHSDGKVKKVMVR